MVKLLLVQAALFVSLLGSDWGTVIRQYGAEVPPRSAIDRIDWKASDSLKIRDLLADTRQQRYWPSAIVVLGCKGDLENGKLTESILTWAEQTAPKADAFWRDRSLVSVYGALDCVAGRYASEKDTPGGEASSIPRESSQALSTLFCIASELEGRSPSRECDGHRSPSGLDAFRHLAYDALTRSPNPKAESYMRQLGADSPNRTTPKPPLQDQAPNLSANREKN